MRKKIFIIFFSSTFFLLIVNLCGKKFYDLSRNHPSGKIILDNKGKPLRFSLSPDEQYRLWFPLKDFSPEMIHLTLIKEDRYFFYHPGINPISFLRAAWHLVSGQNKIGGSTLTMQLAKMHFHLNTRTVPGKFKQILSALFLELLMPKNKILEAYLNLAPYGRNIQGAGAASLIYFHKLPKNLAISESLILALLPQSPKLLKKHRSYSNIQLTQSMKNLFKLYLQQLKDLNKKNYLENALSFLPKLYSIEDLPFLAPHFVNEILEWGPKKTSVIQTTIDLSQQKLLEKILQSYVKKNEIKGIKNAAAMILDFNKMEVTSVVGSANFFSVDIEGQVNGTRAKRSPGSTLKPFVYALAFTQGLIHNQSLLFDVPLKIQTPENFDKKYLGPISAEEALILSRNVPAVDLASKLKGIDLYDILKMAHVSDLKGRGHYGLSLVLGGAEVTMEELVRLYAMLANNGTLLPIQKISGKKIKKGKRLFSAEAAVMVKDILKKNPLPNEDIGRHFYKNQIPVYWKTGTSWGLRDAWSVGFSGPYVVAVWVGNFNGVSNPYFIGAEAAAPLFFEIMDAMRPFFYKDMEFQHNFSSKISEVDVCALSGELLGPFCPHKKKTLFIPGLSPIDHCSLHREVLIENETGLRACLASKGPIEKKVYEFWPTDVLKIFKKNGMERKTPPPYSKLCLMNQRDLQGKPPMVISPEIGQIYHQRVEKSDNSIALEAQADYDTKELFWYLDGELLGKVRPSQTFFWKMHPGVHEIQVVDDLGRASSREVKVVLIQ